MKKSERISTEEVAKIVHDRNNVARNLDEAWREYINFKHRADLRTVAQKKTEAKLNLDLEKQKRDFEELSECTEQLIEETKTLQSAITQKERELVKTERQLSDKTIHAKQMSSHAAELQSELIAAKKRVQNQQKMLDELEKASQTDSISQERDDAQRSVIHLTSLISGQVAHIERVMASLTTPSRPSSQQEILRERRQSLIRSSSPASPGLKRMSSYHEKRMSMSQVGEETFDDKVRIVADTVRKINAQCFAAIEDLASRREQKDDASEVDLPLSPTPGLDSRATTAQSGSLADLQDHVDVGAAVKIQPIAEVAEVDEQDDQFVDASPVIKVQGVGDLMQGIGISIPTDRVAAMM
jgi:chromosome segregation ATPase